MSKSNFKNMRSMPIAQKRGKEPVEEKENYKKHMAII